MSEKIETDRASTIHDAEDAKSHTTADTVQKMKAAVVRKKGRGFDSEIDHTEYSEYDRLEDPDDLDEIGLEHDKSSGPGPQRSVEGWILFIRGLHEETTEDDITDRFADYGDIKNLHVNLDRRTGFIKGYALIEYASYKEAMLAKNELHESEILGNQIEVSWSFVKGPHYSKANRPV